MAAIDDRARLSRYRDVCELKKGGGVMLVRDDLTGTMYVKKTLGTCRADVLDGLMRDPAPGMPRIRDVAYFGDCTVLIEDLVNGGTLQDLLDRVHVLPEARAMEIFRQVAGTVRALHARTPAVIHRDIKP